MCIVSFTIKVVSRYAGETQDLTQPATVVKKYSLLTGRNLE